MVGSVPGTLLGAKIAPRVPQSIIRRGIVVVLTMSGVALLDKAGWAPLGAGEDDTHPMLIAGVGLFVVVVLPIVWGFIRKSQGLPMFGSPTIAQLEDPDFKPGLVGMKRTKRRPDRAASNSSLSPASRGAQQLPALGGRHRRPLGHPAQLDGARHELARWTRRARPG